MKYALAQLSNVCGAPPKQTRKEALFALVEALYDDPRPLDMNGIGLLAFAARRWWFNKRGLRMTTIPREGWPSALYTVTYREWSSRDAGREFFGLTQEESDVLFDTLSTARGGGRPQNAIKHVPTAHVAVSVSMLIAGKPPLTFSELCGLGRELPERS